MESGGGKPYRIALAGCGSMARRWMKYALSRSDADIVALVDIRREAAQAMAAEYNLSCGCYTDLTEAIQETGANLVFDVTVPEAHKQIVTAAVQAGCHVFGEKPLAASMEDAEQIVDLVRRSGKTYAVMQNRRYNKQIRALRQLIAGGAIGTPGFAVANFFLGPHFGGFREAMDNPLLLDMAIHTFDQARFILDADPVSVYCREFNPKGSWYRGNAAAVCIFEFSDGSVFSYNGSWCAQGAPTSWEASWRICGSLGTAVWDGVAMPFAEAVADPLQNDGFIKPCRRIEATAEWDGPEGHEGCLEEMFAALAEGRDAETVCTDNIKSVSMVFGAIESARTGNKVMLV